ncbi:MAG: DNA repair protein RecN [Peptoniphilaceae bacterium]|uniref:DNA repair protein RecN n=1 Tax=Parvimonas sp. TaxID=1944660 RepID=UPI0025E95697|nr:DNA repair protein RecN [Parvimonas sp.]MCI5997577.1 DNA repair protein RecN [Parvimonas sp.]MDD7765172.1 DNA repair protein RecN [Peptoniphilaceae bacterium]MDY3051211.1 DNA repair protein RecN [Parvimonas sp.]
MLSELFIKNFAIIDEVRIYFNDGLNILTGETGAGKSIIINAISLLCGGRSNTSFVGKRGDFSFVEGVFFLSDYEYEFISDKLDRLNLDILIDDKLLSVSRTVYKNGRSVSKLNNVVVNNSHLAEIMVGILNICGQHDSYTLFNRTNFIDVLDSFCDDKFNEKLQKVGFIYGEIKKKTLYLKKLKDKVENFDDDILELKDELEMLNSLNLDDLDDLSLESEIERYSNSKDIISHCYSVMELFDSENSDITLFSMLNEINRHLFEIENDDKSFNCSESFENTIFDLKDVYSKIKNYYESMYIDEESLLILQEKYNLLNDLKRKYKTDKKGLIDLKNNLEEEIFLLEDSKNILYSESQNLKQLKSEYVELSNNISSLRKKTANSFEKMIEKELKDLDLKNAIFSVDIISTNKITSTGFDEVKFLISTNKGEELKEISKVASGGEMSRIMLGFKKVLSDRDKISTLVFDEIDAGISGITAQIVGEKLVDISKNHQLIVISHLPQISVLSDTHFVISKETFGNDTLTKVTKADDEEKIMEISRLIGGANINELTKNQSKEMIKIADDKKVEIRCIKK